MYITGFGLICRQLASLSVIPWGLLCLKTVVFYRLF